MITLGIDTSNYATSISVIDNDKNEILLNKKVFLPIKEGQTGLRQQEAVFSHIKTLTEVLNSEDFSKWDISCIGVSTKPTRDEASYMPCFLVGKLVAYAFAASKNIKVVELSHQINHIYSCLFDLNLDNLYTDECVFLHVSGGTSDILYVKNGEVVKTIGKSQDLYAGQAIDRLGVKLGYPFPSGVYISRLASDCDENIQIKTNVKGYDFNLSGLENKCNQLLSEGKSKEYVCKFCLSFIASTFLNVIKNIKSEYKDTPIICVGGVMSSSVIRKIMRDEDDSILFCKEVFSSDNAIGAARKAYKEAING